MSNRRIKIFGPTLKEWQAVDYDNLEKRVNEFLTQGRVGDPRTYTLSDGIVVEYHDRRNGGE